MLNFSFSVIGITETRIKQSNLNDFNYDIGYSFEFVPTPLAAGGVRLYISNRFNYVVIEKAINIAYRALNSPETFQEYFERVL